MKFLKFLIVFTRCSLCAGLLRNIIPIQLKVPEMNFSDKVDIENTQVCSITPSELGVIVDRSWSVNAPICSYPGFYNSGFIWLVKIEKVNSHMKTVL